VEPADTARVLRTLRGDVLQARMDARDGPRPWDWETYLAVMGLFDQKLHNLSAAADFHDRATRSEP
jgi:hypothetical protein